ncbi:MAG: DUF6494 family protein [Rhodospirillales bacterium]|jgi:hypothetical protein|nr:DUF6494 family protein [Rhodospirillales bacterium]
MHEDQLNMSVRKFLKHVGVTSQREIETAVRAAATAGRLPSGASLPARARITIDGIDLDFTVDGNIDAG